MDGSKWYDALLYPVYLILASPLIVILPIYGLIQMIKVLYNKRKRNKEKQS